METAAILAVVAVCVALIVRKMLRDAGVLKRNGDCGCGKCATRARGKPR